MRQEEVTINVLGRFDMETKVVTQNLIAVRRRVRPQMLGAPHCIEPRQVRREVVADEAAVEGRVVGAQGLGPVAPDVDLNQNFGKRLRKVGRLPKVRVRQVVDGPGLGRYPAAGGHETRRTRPDAPARVADALYE